MFFYSLLDAGLIWLNSRQRDETERIMTSEFKEKDRRESYCKALPNNAKGIAFLFSSRFYDALQVPAQTVAFAFDTSVDSAIEEFRRLIAIKVFTTDKEAEIISPTPLSTRAYLFHTHISCIADQKIQWTNFGTRPFSTCTSTENCKALWALTFTIAQQELAIEKPRAVARV